MFPDDQSSANARRSDAETAAEQIKPRIGAAQHGSARAEKEESIKEIDPSRISGKRIPVTDGIDNSDLRALLAIAIQKAKDAK